MNRYLLIFLLAAAANNLRQSFVQTEDQQIVEEYKKLSDSSAEGEKEITQYKKSTVIKEDPVELPPTSSKSIHHTATVTDDGVTFDFSMEGEEENKKPEIVLARTRGQEVNIDGNSYRIVQGSNGGNEIVGEGSFLGELVDAGYYGNSDVEIIQGNDVNNNVYVYQDGNGIDTRNVLVGNTLYQNNLQPVLVGGTVYQQSTNPVLIDDTLYNLDLMNGDSRFIDGFISELDMFNNNGYIEEEELLNATPMWGFVDLDEMIDYEMEQSKLRGDEISEDDLIDGVISGTIVRPVQIDGGIVQSPRYVTVQSPRYVTIQPQREYIVYAP